MSAPATHGKPAVELFAGPLDASAPRLIERLRARLTERGAALVTRFPTHDPYHYIDVLAELGQPLANYGGGSASAAYTLHPNINVVRCSPAGGERIQEQGGPLPAHSARAFSAHRPRYIAMLMVTAGWPDEPGNAGESTIVRWHDALQQMRTVHPDIYADDYALLSQTPITITAQHVTDEWSTLPLLYPLTSTANTGNADATCSDHTDGGDASDVGARYSLTLPDQLPTMSLAGGLRERYQAALERFTEAANHPAARYVHPLQPGELIILDNNRYGLGRLPFTRSNGHAINPRQLWSVVIG